MLKPFTVIAVMVAFMFPSCIKDEPLNPEADIETFTVDPSLLTGTVFIDNANRKIRLYLKPSAYNSGIAPILTLSKGATVSPASGDSIHFIGPVQYTVTSQSGENKKQYDVEVVSVGNWTFNFEHWQENATDRYEFPVEDNNVQVWSSGNPGVALSGIPKQPTAYPTQHTDDGYLNTKAGMMQTIPGTPLSSLLNIHLFAGSLFLGNFNSNTAFVNPLAATEFGQPYVGKPGRFTGYYKYTPGGTFLDQNGNPAPSLSDSCDLYAVFYNGPERLNGTNVNSSERIIARAAIAERSAKANFTRFDVPFVYRPGVTIGSNTMVAIVASSSYQGGQYRGAIGSKLIVDSLRIIPQ